MAKELTFFDYTNAIQKKQKIEFNDKIFNGYLAFLHFSLYKPYIPIIQELNKHIFNLTNKQIYMYLYDKIPKGNVYIK